MLADVTIGQYFPGDSLLHRMDPRVKLVLTLAFIILVFVPKSWAGLLLAVAFLIAAVVFSRLPLRLVLKSMKPIAPIVVLTSLINMFYIPGDEIFSLGFLHVTRAGRVYRCVYRGAVALPDRGQLAADLYDVADDADRRARAAFAPADLSAAECT